MVSEKSEWITKEKPVFNVDTGMIETLWFLHKNHINNYNNTMGNLDFADKL